MNQSFFRYVAIETAASAVFTAIANVIITYLLFDGQQSIQPFGVGGAVFDIVPTTFMGALMSSAIPVWLMKRRIKKGNLTIRVNTIRWLPGNFIVRAALPALVFAMIAFGVAWALCKAYLVADIPFMTLLGFKAIYGIFTAIIATPIGVHLALCAPRQRAKV